MSSSGLARELEELDPSEVRLVLGHGSGSFGHVAAARHGIHEGVETPEQLLGVTETQDRAATLNRLVIGALRRSGVPAFSLAPSSFLVSAGGVPAELWIEPLLDALHLGMLPVVHGDVVMDRELGASISSTEAVFLALAERLQARSVIVRRSIWLGETDGIYDSRGDTIEELQLEAVGEVLDQTRRAHRGPTSRVACGIAWRRRPASLSSESSPGSRMVWSPGCWPRS